MIGRRYVLPRAVAAALERVFEGPADDVIVVERSRYAKLHRGMSATTRPNRILLAISGAEFVARPELLLHEYYHVLRQWRCGYLTRWQKTSILCRLRRDIRGWHRLARNRTSLHKKERYGD